MQRIHLYLKVTIEAGDDERTDRMGSEISRMVKRVYGVRDVEVTNQTSETVPDIVDEDD